MLAKVYGSTISVVVPDSVLTKNQSRTLKRVKNGYTYKVELRYDDRCGNGHNTFGITGEFLDKHGTERCGGCIHEEIREVFPELAYLIEWHLCSTDGPMHYVANTLYHAEQGNLLHARTSSIWSSADLSEFNEKNLMARLPGLMVEFRKVIEGLGFTY